MRGTDFHAYSTYSQSVDDDSHADLQDFDDENNDNNDATDAPVAIADDAGWDEQAAVIDLAPAEVLHDCPPTLTEDLTDQPGRLIRLLFPPATVKRIIEYLRTKSNIQ